MFIDRFAGTFPLETESIVPRVALVVDDSMLIRHTVCRFFEERGFAVESACNGVEALELMKTVLPDVIITDLQMPKMDGNKLIDKLKDSPKTAGITIWVLKGKNTTNYVPFDPLADCAIYKDIDIMAIFNEALKKTLDKPKD